MAAESSYRRVEEESREITSGKKSPTPQERAPPRPSDMPGTPSKGRRSQGWVCSPAAAASAAAAPAASVSARLCPRPPPSATPSQPPFSLITCWLTNSGPASLSLCEPLSHPASNPCPLPAVATGRGGGDRADVHIRTDSRDQVHVDVETHEGAIGKVRSPAGAGGG